MSQSKSMLSYSDVQGVLDRALNSERGIRVARDSPGAATHFRQRLYTFRKLHRKSMEGIYEEGDLRKGTSPYDVLVVEIVESNVLIKKTELENIHVEDL